MLFREETTIFDWIENRRITKPIFQLGHSARSPSNVSTVRLVISYKSTLRSCFRFVFTISYPTWIHITFVLPIMSFISNTYIVSPCELHCTPEGLFGLYFSKKLADQVHDGTPCHLGKRDVCINGKCEVCVLTTIALVYHATKCVN